MTSEIDRSPARLSSALTLGAGGVAAGSAGTSIGGAFGVLGLLLLAVGVVRGSRSAVTAGAWTAFIGVVVAGTVGAAPELLLVGTAAAVLAWDFGEQAISLGEQLGRAARTRNLELVHAANSTLVAVAGVALAYGLFLFASGGQPVTALVALLAAALVLAAALRD